MRDKKLDGLKFILIFLVVLGHMGYRDWGLYSARLIYAFHMPAFVLLSGYFTSVSGSMGKNLQWLLKIFGIYLIAQWGQCLYVLLVPYFTHDQMGIVRAEELFGISPAFSLWYLMSLCYWRMILWICHNKVSDKLMLGVSCLLTIVVGWVPIGHCFSFQRTFVFMPIFLAGYMVRKRNIQSRIDDIPPCYCLIIFAVGMCVARFLPTYIPSSYYQTAMNDVILRIVQTTMGAVLAVAFVRLLRVFPIEVFSGLGKHTLWVYVGHVFLLFVHHAVCRRCHISLNIITAAIFAVVYSYGLALAALCIDNIKKRMVGSC